MKIRLQHSWLSLYWRHWRVAAFGAPASSSSAATPASSSYVSFSAWISSPFYSSYSGSISVSGYASFRDTDCYPSYQCDRDVFAEFELRRGYGSFAPLVGRASDTTGQYGSSLRASFRVPACRSIPKYKTVTYTLLMEAVAPNGDTKTDRRYIYARSCRF